MRRRPRYVLFLGAKFRTISFLHNTQKWVKKRIFIRHLRQKPRLLPTNLLFHYPQIVSARPRRQRLHRHSPPPLERRTSLLKRKKSPTFAVKRRTFTTPVQCCFSGYACWHVAACRSEISAAVLRRQGCGRPRVSA